MQKENQKDDSKLGFEKLKKKQLLAEKMLHKLKEQQSQSEQLEKEEMHTDRIPNNDNFDNLIGCGG